MDWHSPLGICLPLFLVIISVLIIYLYYFINNCKLNSTGYGDIVKAVQGYEIIAETNEDVFGREEHFGSVNDPGNLTFAMNKKKHGLGRAASV